MTRHLRIKRIYLLGLVADLLAMVFLVLQSRAGLELNTIYSGTAIFALVMFALSFAVVHQAAAAPCGLR